jgi:hypothetical protein
MSLIQNSPELNLQAMAHVFLQEGELNFLDVFALTVQSFFCCSILTMRFGSICSTGANGSAASGPVSQDSFASHSQSCWWTHLVTALLPVVLLL